MAISLNMFVTVERNTISADGKLELIVDITAQGKDIQGASIAIVIAPNAGSFLPTSGVTTVNGIFRTVYTPNLAIAVATNYNITFTASKTGYTSVSKTILITVKLAEVLRWTKEKEFEMGCYKIRDILLRTIQDILDLDEELYPSTGASDKPVYLNAWSFTTKKFPQIIISGGKKSGRQGISIGDHFIGDSLEDDDSVIYNNRGGWDDFTFNLSVVAEDKIVQSKLLDKCIDAVWKKQRMKLLAQEILVISVDGGNETTQPYGAKFLYGATVNVNCATQWFLREAGITQVKTVDVTPSVT